MLMWHASNGVENVIIEVRCVCIFNYGSAHKLNMLDINLILKVE